MTNNTQPESQASVSQRSVRFSRLFWSLLACVNLVTVGWIGWLLWQISPRPIVNDLVYQPQQLRSSRHGSETQTAPGRSADSPMVSGTPIETLRLETELKMPSASAKGPAPIRPSARSVSN